MNKLFVIERPDQLKELNAFTKDGDIPRTRILRMASMWSADQRRNGGKSRCDGNVMVSFFTEGHERHARIFRANASPDLQDIAVLKYAPALKWCTGRLKPVEVSAAT